MARGLVTLLVALAAGTASAATVPPSLHVRSVAPFSVQATYFRPFERIRVTLNGTWTRVAVSSRTGVVVVTIRNATADRCSGFTIKAVGSKGSRAVLRARPLACSTRI